MNTMQRAHELAKQGVNRFGGKHVEYFSEALKIAYREQKALIKVVDRKPSIIIFVFVTLFILLASFTSVESVASIKLVNPDIPINFIDVENKFNNFKFRY